MAGEMERLVTAFGIGTVTEEVLYEAELVVQTEWPGAEPPYYERFGAARVAAALRKVDHPRVPYPAAGIGVAGMVESLGLRRRHAGAAHQQQIEHPGRLGTLLS